MKPARLIRPLGMVAYAAALATITSGLLWVPLDLHLGLASATISLASVHLGLVLYTQIRAYRRRRKQ